MNDKPIIVREDRMDSVDKICSKQFIGFVLIFLGIFLIILVIIVLNI